MIGNISEYHFNGIIEAVVERRIVIIVQSLFMHNVHFVGCKTFTSTFCIQEEAVVLSALDCE
jgi:hypothetical protein